MTDLEIPSSSAGQKHTHILKSFKMERGEKSKQRKMDIYPQKRVLDALLQGTD